MIGNFKLVRKISFRLPNYSSLPLTFENVYVDRFNSIFKGFYLLLNADEISGENVNDQQSIIFTKVHSTERFGAGLNASDILFVDIVDKRDLTDEELKIITYLNLCIKNKYYHVVE